MDIILVANILLIPVMLCAWYWYLFLPAILLLGYFKKWRALGWISAAFGMIFACCGLIGLAVSSTSPELPLYTIVCALEALIVLGVYLACRFWWSRRKPRAGKAPPETVGELKMEKQHVERSRR
jgi:hypothetical protein